jgi:adenosylhomocysteine nucleosidase
MSQSKSVNGGGELCGAFPSGATKGGLVFAAARRNRPWFAAGLLAMVLTIAAGCRSPLSAAKPAHDFDAAPRLAIMSAFEPELEKLRQQTEITAVRVINGRSYYLGRLAGHEVVLVLSGISMVNASMTAETLLDHFRIREVIFSGIAGGVNPNLNIGDVVVPAQWGQYQEQLFARQTAGSWDTDGWGTNFSNYGMMFPQDVQVTRRGGPPDQLEKRFWFPVDAASLEAVQRITNTVVLASRLGPGDGLAATPRVVLGGRGVSGPTFVDNTAYRQWVWTTFQADALDMETAAVATVAYVNRVPFIAFRSLSDLAGGGPGKNEMTIFFKLAAANSAAVVVGYLKALDEKKLGLR